VSADPEPLVRSVVSQEITRAGETMRRLFVLCGIAMAVAGFPQQASAQSGWTTYVDAAGTRVEYPADVFSREGGGPEIGTGKRFSTADGRAHLSIYTLRNSRGQSPASYLRTYMKGPRRTLNYDRVARNFFAVSTNRNGTVLYRRCNFSANRGGTMHCIDRAYPQREKRAWDAPVTRISRSLRPLYS
jgi:hypothetical protein